MLSSRRRAWWVYCRAYVSSYADDYELQVFLGFCAAYIFMQTFMIPGTIVMSLLAGSLFGPIRGMMVVIFNASAGASCCFFLSKLVGRPLALWMWPGRLQFFKAEVGPLKIPPSPHPDYCDNWFEIWSNPCSLVYYCSFIRWPSLFPVVSYMALIRVLLTKAPVANNWDQSCVCRWPSKSHICSTTCCSSELLQPYRTLSSTWLLLLLEFHMAHFSLQPYLGSSQPPSYLFEWVLLLLSVCFISDSYPLWPFFFLFLWGLDPMI